MIVNIVHDGINNDIGEHVVKGLDAHLMIGPGAGLAMHHGVIVAGIIRDVVDHAVRGQNTETILGFEIGKMRHECIKKELKRRRTNQLATHDKGVLGRQIGIGVQDAKGIRKLSSDGAAAKAEYDLYHGDKIQSAGAGKVGLRMNAILSTILIKCLNGIQQGIKHLIRIKCVDW